MGRRGWRLLPLLPRGFRGHPGLDALVRHLPFQFFPFPDVLQTVGARTQLFPARGEALDVFRESLVRREVLLHHVIEEPLHFGQDAVEVGFHLRISLREDALVIHGVARELFREPLAEADLVHRVADVGLGLHIIQFVQQVGSPLLHGLLGRFQPSFDLFHYVREHFKQPRRRQGVYEIVLQ